MGNADSAHEHVASGSADGAHHQHQPHFDSAPSTLQYTRKSNHLHHQQHHHSHYTHSDRENNPQQYSHQQQPQPPTASSIKVLPKLCDQAPPGLRTTNNGLILHNGGTISARNATQATSTTAKPSTTNASRFSRPPSGPPQRDPPPPAAIARALGGIASSGPKPTSAHQPSLMSGLPPLMKRSRTQHDMLGAASATSNAAANGWAANSRRYYHMQRQTTAPKTTTTTTTTVVPNQLAGGSGDSDCVHKTNNVRQKTATQSQSLQGGPTSLKAKVNAATAATTTTTVSPSPKKYSAPLPPTPPSKTQQQQQQQQQRPPTAFVAPVPRKLRMFKTKAESRKSSAPAAAVTGGATSSTEQQQQPTTARSREPTRLDVRRSHSPPAQPSRQPAWHMPRIDVTAAPDRLQLRTQPTAAQLQANYLRREKSFDLNLLRAHHETTAAQAADTLHRQHQPSYRQRIADDAAASVTTGSTSGASMPPMTAGEHAKMPLVRQRQMQEPQLIGLGDLHQHRFHVAPAAAVDENNNLHHIATADAAHTAAILDEYLTKSIHLDAISRFTDALQQHGPAAAVQTPANRYLSPPVVDNTDDFEAHSSSTDSSSSLVDDGGNIGANRGNASDTTASSMLSYHADAVDQRAHGSVDDDEGEAHDGSVRQHITINVRPTLPRRQFDIPRFNPAEAWRSLNEAAALATAAAAVELSAAHRVAEECLVRPLSLNRVRRRQDDEGHDDGHMHEQLRQRLQHYDSSRSAESGISSGEDLQQQQHAPIGARKSGELPSTWTPLQDLGDDDEDDDNEMVMHEDDDELLSEYSPPPMAGKLDDSDEPSHFYPEAMDNITRSRQRNHCSMFSLSLPRDSHMTSSTTDHEATAKTTEFSSLKKQHAHHPVACASPVVQCGDNWLLSPSAPNSLDIVSTTGAGQIGGTRSTTTTAATTLAAEQRQRSSAPLSSYTTPPLPSLASLHYFSTGPHVMCLPAANTDEAKQRHSNQQQQRNPASYAADANGCDPSESSLPSALAIATTQHRLATKISGHRGHSSSSHHRFTFQSTVRQIERRRLAERLSHEAAAMESQRRNEVESMQRVEEEFERKRRHRQQQQQQQQQRSYQSLPTASDDAIERYDAQNADGGSGGIIDTHSPYIHRLVEQKSGRI